MNRNIIKNAEQIGIDCFIKNSGLIDWAENKIMDLGLWGNKKIDQVKNIYNTTSDIIQGNIPKTYMDQLDKKFNEYKNTIKSEAPQLAQNIAEPYMNQMKLFGLANVASPWIANMVMGQGGNRSPQNMAPQYQQVPPGPFNQQRQQGPQYQYREI